MRYRWWGLICIGFMWEILMLRGEMNCDFGKLGWSKIGVWGGKNVGEMGSFTIWYTIRCFEGVRWENDRDYVGFFDFWMIWVVGWGEMGEVGFLSWCVDWPACALGKLRGGASGGKHPVRKSHGIFPNYRIRTYVCFWKLDY